MKKNKNFLELATTFVVKGCAYQQEAKQWRAIMATIGGLIVEVEIVIKKISNRICD